MGVKEVKLGVAGFGHETISFWPGLTDIKAFERRAKHGGEVIEKNRGTNTSIGGFIDICEAEGVELFSVCDARGGATAIVADRVYDFYVGEMKREFKRVADELDGILLALHGAMATQSRQDPETDVVREIRQVVGYEMPIMVTFDLHANKDLAILKEASAIFGYQSSPHIDAGETGRRAARAMLATLRGEIKPTMAMARPGIAGATVFSATTIAPMKDIIARLHEWEERPKVVDVSIFFGFPWSDVHQVGMSMVAVTDNNLELAQEVVDDLARLAWDKRKALTGRDKAVLYSVKDGVALAIKKAECASKPIVILDFADRTGDTTWVLQELLAQGAKNTALPCFYSPEAARDCYEIGVGSTVELKVGGSTGWLDGGPVKVEGKVLWAGEGKYIGTGPMSKNREIDLGITAIVDVDGIWLQLITHKAQLIDEDPIIQFGYKTSDFDVIVSKSKTHFREVYEKVGEEIIIVEAPGQGTADLSIFEYKNVLPGVYNITNK